MENKSSEAQSENFALIKILDMGQAEIELLKFRIAEEVFAEMDQSLDW